MLTTEEPAGEALAVDQPPGQWGDRARRRESGGPLREVGPDAGYNAVSAAG